MSGESILIIEPSEPLLQVISYNLKKRKYNIISTTTGKEGFNLLESLGRVDLILINSILPDIGGIELGKKIKSSYPSIPIIILSAVCIKEEIIKASRANIRNFITFPFLLEEMLEKIDNVLKEKGDENYSVINIGKKTVVVLKESLDHFFSNRLKNILNDLINSTQYNIIIDLSEADFLAHQNLVVLISASEKILHLGGSIKIVGINEDIQKMFKKAKLETYFKIYPTRADALRAS
ncbi:MAG: response regulator [Candidatus Hydrogenedentota bacterium]